MKKIIVGFVFSVFCGLNLFSNEVDSGLYFAMKGDFTKAKELWEHACFMGDSNGCNNLGNLYESGQGVEQNYSEANDLYKLTCDTQVARGCFNLGLSYAKGNGVDKDIIKAKNLFAKACYLGEQKGCYYSTYLH